MTSVGDTSGYSTAWFSPKQTFTGATTVSWDVNVTDLGARQWWEVAIVPTAWNSGIAACPQCSSETWVPSELPYYPDGSVVVGNGPFGGDFHVHANNRDFNPADDGFCRTRALDPEGCASKAIRRTFVLTDNGNNTLTLRVVGPDLHLRRIIPRRRLRRRVQGPQLHPRQRRKAHRPHLALGQPSAEMCSFR